VVNHEILIEIEEKICFNFLWNKKADKRHAHERIARNKLKLDFCHGGIKAPDIFSIDKALKIMQYLRSTDDLCEHPICFIQIDFT